MTIGELSYHERDILMIQYKDSFKQVYGYPLSYTKELIIIRNNITASELRQRIIELDTMLLKRSLHSIY